MDSSGNLFPNVRIDAEAGLIKALCVSQLTTAMRHAILSQMSKHRFTDPDHEVIYRALSALPAMDAADMLQALTQSVTRMGFPDLDLNGLFTGQPPAAEEIATLLTRL